MKHTPTPWKRSHALITGKYNKRVAVLYTHSSNVEGSHEAINDMDYAIKCVNAHDELMEFVKWEAETECNCKTVPFLGLVKCRACEARELIETYGGKE